MGKISPSSIGTYILKRIQFSIELDICSHSTCFPRRFCWMIVSLYTEVQVTIPPCPLRHRNQRMPWDLGLAKHECEKNAMGFVLESCQARFMFRKQALIPGNNMGVINKIWRWHDRLRWRVSDCGCRIRTIMMCDTQDDACQRVFPYNHHKSLTPKGPSDDFFLQQVITTWLLQDPPTL